MWGHETPQITVRLLGGLRVELTSATLAEHDIPTRARMVVELLALASGHTMRRDQLIETIWPDGDPQRGANNLHKALHHLRSAAPDPVLRNLVRLERGGVSLDPAVRVDLDELRDAAAAARVSGAIEAYERALALDVGELLPTDRYEDWAGLPRDEHTRRMRDVRLELAARYRAEDQLNAAVVTLRPLVEADDTDEAARLALMRVYAESGEVARALRQYDVCTAALRRDHAVEPSGGLVRLRASIAPDGICHRTEDEHPGMVDAGLGATPCTAPFPLPLAFLAHSESPFVSRDRELAAFRDACRRGTRRLVTVTGEAGIGKTRLVGALGHAVHADGGLVLYGVCDREVRAPYGPFVEALRQLLASAPVDIETALRPGQIARLHRLLPDEIEAATRVRPIDAQLSDRDTERRLFHEAVDALLVACAHVAPVLLVLDDLHWADPDTLVLLRTLASGPDRARIVIVGTYRDTDIDRRHDIIGTLADSHRAAPVVRLPLDGLDVAQTATLISACTGSDVDQKFCAWVHEATAGNPFFVCEVVRHVIDTGALDRESGVADVDGTFGDLGIPAGVSDTVARRLAQLPDQTSQALAAAAVIGQQFDVEVLARTTELAAGAVIDALEPALRAGLVREGLAVGRFAFVHALVRDALDYELLTVRRVRLHRRVGEAIESLYADDLDTHLDALAAHYEAAAADGDIASAVMYLRRASDRALAQGLWDHAAMNLQRAERLLDSARDVSAEWGDIVGELSRVLTGCHQVDKARALLARATDRARASRDRTVLARVILGHEGLTESGRDNAVLFSDIAEARNRLAPDDVALRPGLDALEAVLRMRSVPTRESLQRARALADAAVAATSVPTGGAASGATPRWRVVALNAAFHVRMGSADLADSRRIAEELAAIPFDLDDLATGSSNLFRRCIIELRLGDRAAFDATSHELRASQAPTTPGGAWVHEIDGLCALLEGRLADSAAHVKGVLGALIDNPEWAKNAHGQLQQVRYEQGHLEAERMLAIAEKVPGLVAQRAQSALMFAEEGATERALEVVAPLAAGGFAAMPLDSGRSIFLRFTAELVAHLNAEAWAATLLEALVPYDGQLLVAYMTNSCQGSAARSIALLETVLGRFDDADAHFAAGLALEEGFGGRQLAARTRTWWAHGLRRRNGPGDNARASANARAAHAEAAVLGLRGTTNLLHRLELT